MQGPRVRFAADAFPFFEGFFLVLVVQFLIRVQRAYKAKKIANQSYAVPAVVEQSKLIILIQWLSESRMISSCGLLNRGILSVETTG